MGNRLQFATLVFGTIGIASIPVAQPQARTDEVVVAVAANFTGAMKTIAAKYTARTGNKVTISYGSTGKLYAQIKNGAPFDVFLAADAQRPRLLEDEGRALAGSRFTYAIGRLVLWSPNKEYIDNKGNVLHHGDYRHLAIANPKTAPYGAAARDVLLALGLWRRLQRRLVYGENIAQTYQFVASGNAELGFVALSQVMTHEPSTRGSLWHIPAGLYRPIEQQAVLLRSGRATAAESFLSFLRGPEARTVIESFGYATPPTSSGANHRPRQTVRKK